MKSEPPPPEVEGARGIGPLNGDEGETAEPKPPPLPNPVEIEGWGKVREGPVAGDAGWEPKLNGELAAAAGAPNENGAD